MEAEGRAYRHPGSSSWFCTSNAAPRNTVEAGSDSSAQIKTPSQHVSQAILARRYITVMQFYWQLRRTRPMIITSTHRSNKPSPARGEKVQLSKTPTVALTALCLLASGLHTPAFALDTESEKASRRPIGDYNTEDADLVKELSEADPSSRYEIAIEDGKTPEYDGTIELSEPYEYLADGSPVYGMIDPDYSLSNEEMLEQGFISQEEYDQARAAEERISADRPEAASYRAYRCGGANPAPHYRWRNVYGGGSVRCFTRPGGRTQSTMITHLCAESSHYFGRTLYAWGTTTRWSKWRSGKKCYIMPDIMNNVYYGLRANVIRGPK